MYFLIVEDYISIVLTVCVTTTEVVKVMPNYIYHMMMKKRGDATQLTKMMNII